MKDLPNQIVATRKLIHQKNVTMEIGLVEMGVMRIVKLNKSKYILTHFIFKATPVEFKIKCRNA